MSYSREDNARTAGLPKPSKVAVLKKHPGWEVVAMPNGGFFARSQDGDPDKLGPRVDKWHDVLTFVRSWTRNPWIEQPIHGELAYTGEGYTGRQAAEIVRGEFADGPEPFLCDCGSVAHYRATVGALQCPKCRALYTSSGEPI